jgi:hypothetical protein
MIEAGEVDLNRNFDLRVSDWDSVMNFPGYSVSVTSDVDNSARLVKKK